MRKKIFKVLRVAVITIAIMQLAMVVQGPVHASSIKTESSYVQDKTGILTESQISDLEQLSEKLYETNGVQVATYVTDKYAGTDAHKYATDLFNTMGLGSKTENNGMLLFIAFDSGDVEVVTGIGMTGVFTNRKIGEILETNFMPNARENSSKAIIDTHTALVDESYDYYTGMYDNPVKTVKESSKGNSPITSELMLVGKLLISTIFIAFIIFFIARNTKKRKNRVSNYNDNCDHDYSRDYNNRNTSGTYSSSMSTHRQTPTRVQRPSKTYSNISRVIPTHGNPVPKHKTESKPVNQSTFNGGKSSGSGAGRSFEPSKPSSSFSSPSKSSSAPSFKPPSFGGGKSSGGGLGRKF